MMEDLVKVKNNLMVIVIIESFIYYCLTSDIDECAVDNGGCDETCINTNGSYSCQCNSGLKLLSDKKSCGCEQKGLLITFSLLVVYIFVHSIQRLHTW